MRKKTQYFIMNKENDFMRGSGASYRNGAAYLKKYFFSHLYDSGKKDVQWYRLVSEFETVANTGLLITFYVSENDRIEYDDKWYDIRELLGSSVDVEQKKTILSALEKKTVRYSQEILLTELHGRYLFFLIENKAGMGQEVCIRKMKLYFEPNMWIHDLPEIFRQEENGFLERYLAIFQNIYEDMEEQINCNSDNYSVYSQSYELILWLSSWYCMSCPGLWTREQLQYLLKNSYRIYQRLGTREILEEICELYLGEKPDIVEYYEAEREDFKDQWNLSKKVLAVNPYVFTIIIKNARLSDIEYDHFLKIVDSIKPVHMEANIIMLSDRDQKDNVITLL